MSSISNDKIKRLALIAVAGMALQSGMAHASEAADSDKVIHFPFEQEEVELPDYLVNGIIHDTAQKILPLSVEARFYSPHLDMSVKSDKIYYNDGSVSLKDDLGFGNDNAPEFILRYKRLTLDYIYVKGDGDRNFSGRNVLTFGGSRYHGDVHSESKLHYLKLNVTNPIISVFGSGIGWSYGLTGLSWKGSVDGDNTGGRKLKEDEDLKIPLPTLGINAHASLLPSLKAYANLSGLPLGGYGHFYDFEAGVRYNPIDILGVDVGYRRIHVNYHHDDKSGTLTMNGPFAGLRFDF